MGGGMGSPKVELEPYVEREEGESPLDKVLGDKSYFEIVPENV
jgi:hypothetical protein